MQQASPRGPQRADSADLAALPAAVHSSQLGPAFTELLPALGTGGLGMKGGYLAAGLGLGVGLKEPHQGLAAHQQPVVPVKVGGMPRQPARWH